MLCEICIKIKITDAPYPKSVENRETEVLKLTPTDVWNPIQTSTIGGKAYFMAFIDDFSSFTIIYLLSKNSEVLTNFKKFIATENFPEMLRSDRDSGDEYTNSQTENY